MAKNDPLPTAVLVTDGDKPVASYMRKDTHMLFDGTWYISTPCPKCGLVDEEVPWAEAKTPHHAGLIADQRHLACAQQLEAIAMKEVAKQENEAAAQLLRQQHFNRDQAAKAVRVIEGEPKDAPLRDRRLAAARAELARHEKGLKEAERRLHETRAANQKVIDG